MSDAAQNVVDAFADAAVSVAGEAVAPLIEQVLGWIDELIAAGGTMADLPAMLAEKIPTLGEAAIADLAELLNQHMLASNLVGREAANAKITQRRGGAES